MLNFNKSSEMFDSLIEFIKLARENKEFKEHFVKEILSDEGLKSLSELMQVRAVAFKFIHDQRISCPEATVEDRVYENAPELVENLANIIGYYKYDDNDDDTDD